MTHVVLATAKAFSDAVRVVLPRQRAARTENDDNDNLTEMDGVAHGS